MISDLAIDALAEIRGRGLTPTDADVVRLHALALRVQYAEDSTEVYAAPRVAWLGKIPIYEPTLASSMWMADHGERISADADTRDIVLLWACAHAQIDGFFKRPGMGIALWIKTQIAFWLRVTGIDCHTIEQVRNALNYVRFGHRVDACEYPPEYVRKGIERHFDATTSDLLHARLHDAIALLGADAERGVSTLTLTALDCVLLRSALSKGATLKGASADALGDFYAALEEIAARLESEVPRGN